jgi:ribulose-5-phosphate 4-epimerase/fuculose-1-phosphate aldolase
MANLDNYRKDMVDASKELLKLGIMTKSNHGNLSMRVPGSTNFMMTAGASLGNVKEEAIALFDEAGNVIEGTVLPVGAEIIQMHGIVYRKRPEFASVLHTHSPFATGFACAGMMIPPAYEAMVRGGALDGVPIAGYGPRGSDLSVNNIAGCLEQYDAIRGVLLENHGVLTFGDSLNTAIRANMTIEESAEILLNSYKLGGPKLIPREMISATRERAAGFAAAGTQTAEQPRS